MGKSLLPGHNKGKTKGKRRGTEEERGRGESHVKLDGTAVLRGHKTSLAPGH